LSEDVHSVSTEGGGFPLAICESVAFVVALVGGAAVVLVEVVAVVVDVVAPVFPHPASNTQDAMRTQRYFIIPECIEGRADRVSRIKLTCQDGDLCAGRRLSRRVTLHFVD
jgi:hypothetical protein